MAQMRRIWQRSEEHGDQWLRLSCGHTVRLGTTPLNLANEEAGCDICPPPPPVDSRPPGVPTTKPADAPARDGDQYREHYRLGRQWYWRGTWRPD